MSGALAESGGAGTGKMSVPECAATVAAGLTTLRADGIESESVAPCGRGVHPARVIRSGTQAAEAGGSLATQPQEKGS
jgi:hypothetical protein